MDMGGLAADTGLFTFHYVSILILTGQRTTKTILNLHSIMSLF